MNGRAIAHVALITSMAATGACSGSAAVDVSMPAAAYAETSWEAGFDDAEFTTWREGVIRRMEPAAHERIDEYPPAPGAVVELFAPHPSGRPPLRKIGETTAGPDGRFRLGPGPAGRWVLRARSAGGAVTYGGNVPLMRGAFPIPEGDIQMMVRGGRPLDVRLVGADGAPVAGGAVRGSALGYEEVGATGDDRLVRFVAPEGAVYVDAWDPGRRGARELVEVPRPEGAAPFELRAPDHGPLRGWVVAAESGAPLVGAVVFQTERPDVFAVTGDDGRFELVAARTGRVAAFGRGRAYRSYDVPAAGEVELRLRRGAVVTGRVVDSAGEGVPEARVVAVAATTAGGRERVLGPVTDADGRFTFDWLPSPAAAGAGGVSLLAVRRGHGSSAALTLDARGGVAGEPLLVLGGERRIAGRVVRAAGAPCAAATVRVVCDPEGLSAVDAALLGAAWDTSCQTDAEGRFEFVGVPARLESRLSLRVDGTRLERRVAPGGDATVDLELAAGKSISGRVVDVDGQPVTLGGEAWVDLLNDPEIDMFRRRAPVGPDGSFRIDDLPDGEYSVRAKIRTFEVGGAVATAGADDVELVAERPADLDFELVFPTGAQRVPVTVTLRDAADPAVPSRSVRIDPDAPGARGRIEIVRHGRYDVTAAGGAWRCRMTDVAIADGRRPPLRLVLERTLVRRLSLVDAGGGPLPGRRIIVVPVGARGISPETVFTGEGGVVELGGLAEGEWEARVVEDGRPPIVHRFTVDAERDDEIALRYPAHGRIEVVIDAEVAAGGDGAVISLEDASGTSLVAWGPRAFKLASRWRVPADGRLELRGVPVGRVAVVFTPPSGSPSRRQTDVAAGGTTTVRLP